jgi:hypothetical protein
MTDQCVLWLRWRLSQRVLHFSIPCTCEEPAKAVKLVPTSVLPNISDSTGHAPTDVCHLLLGPPLWQHAIFLISSVPPGCLRAGYTRCSSTSERERLPTPLICSSATRSDFDLLGKHKSRLNFHRRARVSLTQKAGIWCLSRTGEGFKDHGP